jgi:flagellin-like hook-associated protein FlgL
MRANLISLQDTVSLLSRTQERLATGKRVNSALDNPINYFAAQNYTNRASDLDARKDGMGEAIQTVKAANAGVEAIQKLIESARGIAQAARASSDATARAAFAAQFDDIRGQIDALAGDSGYAGTNLLAGDTLTVTFNEDGTSTLDIVGFDATTAATGIDVAAAANAWLANGDVDAALADLEAALTEVRSQSQALSSSLSIVEIRSEFTDGIVNTLVDGADKLTAADMNEEGANMLMLQTRQALGTTALSIASQAAQAVLRLF